MNMLLLAENDYLILSAAQQSLDQLGIIPWWLWLVILVILLSLLVVGLFVREEDRHRYPGMKKPLPERAYDQTSTGTEPESDLIRKSQTKENSFAENP